MTLKQIDERLCLWKEYQNYRWKYWTCIHYKFLRQLFPNRFIHFEAYYSFDQWLFQNGHEDLVIYETRYSAGIDPYERGSFVYDDLKVIKWQKDPFGKWMMAHYPGRTDESK